MTEHQRLQRARKLVIYLAGGCQNSLAWRKANPGIRGSDKNVADLCQGELDWLSRWMEEHPGVPVPDGDSWQKLPGGAPLQESKQCIGVADRPCGKEISRRRKRCPACAAEEIRLKQPGYRRDYFRSHREPLNAKRNQRRRRQHQRERAAETAAAKREERARRTAMPRMIVDKHTGKQYLIDPKTGQREELNPGGGF